MLELVMGSGGVGRSGAGGGGGLFYVAVSYLFVGGLRLNGCGY